MNCQVYDLCMPSGFQGHTTRISSKFGNQFAINVDSKWILCGCEFDSMRVISNGMWHTMFI